VSETCNVAGTECVYYLTEYRRRSVTRHYLQRNATTKMLLQANKYKCCTESRPEASNSQQLYKDYGRISKNACNLEENI